jgi:hypothetical protein
MNYLKIYTQIVDNALNSNRKKKCNVYYELHHIIPLCMNGVNKKHNKVLLTAREHFICHKILFILHPTNKKLALAYHSMAYTNTKFRKLKLSSRDFERVRIACSFATSGKNNPRYGAIVSEETRKKIGAKSGLHPSWNKGKKHSEETKNKMRIKGRGLGIPKSQQMKDKLSATQKIKPNNPGNGEIMITRKPISAIDPLGNHQTFSGASEMNKLFGLNMTCIWECLIGTQKTTRGWYNFKYL